MATGPSKDACQLATAVNFGYVANVGDGTISVVDLTREQIVGSISGFSQPWNVNITPDGRTLFVDDMPIFTPQKTSIAVVDTCTSKTTHRFPTGGLAIGSMPAHGRELFTAKYFRFEVEVLNTTDLTVKAAYRTKTMPLATVSDEEGTEIWVGGLPNIVYRIDRATGRSTEDTPIRTSAIPQQLSLTPDKATLAVADCCDIALIDTANQTVRCNIRLAFDFGSPAYGGFTPDGSHLWMAYFNGQVVVVDMSTEKIVAVHQTGGQAIGATFSRDGSKVYISTTPPGSIIKPLGLLYPLLNFGEVWKPGGIVRIYDTRTFTESHEIKVGNSPQAIAIPGVSK
jgi:DNA-binding beta-propeller fold protein YncE